MPDLRTNRHLSAADIALTAEWIMEQPDAPSWSEVRKFVLKELAIDRTTEALRRVPDLKKARTARAAAPKMRKPASGARPTTRKIEALQAHISRLEGEIHRLEAEKTELLERNLRLINGARVHQIPEADLDRPLVPVNRNPTNFPTQKARK